MGTSAEHHPLWERYVRNRGRVHLTGLQALVRLPLEQVRRDRAAGRRVGALVSGYPGSPLAGLDQALGRVEPLLREHDVRFLPGLNEELAASAVAGTQLFDLFPHERFDGVVGLWFGKAPGLDRAIDALRHSNFMGTSRFGGALAVVGDDPYCKSSSLPSHSEHAFAHAFVPLLAPGDAAEVLELGLHGFALSRFAGLWAGLKVSADVADGGVVFELPDPVREFELPKFEVRGAPFRKRFDPHLLPPAANRIEEELVYERLEAVRRYAFANALDRITRSGERDRIGLVASGRLYRELETALARLGLEGPELERLGLRLYQLRMLWPLEPRRLREFAEGLDEIVVVDERRGFIEEQIRAALYDAGERPAVLGTRDERGQPWLARHVEMSSETLALDLAPHLAARLGEPELEQRAGLLSDAAARLSTPGAHERSPHFCSGCPHATSTRLPGGAVAGGGIGCHTMTLLRNPSVPFVGAMGSEGAHWTGLAPFVDEPHLFQNLGDGTYFHSGRLAVRAAVAAGAHMTFKILYNGAIAMTGGQGIPGGKSVIELARDLLADGVQRIIAVSGDRKFRRFARLHRRVRIVRRERWEQELRSIARKPGVSAAIYDELCANEKQRLERRGLRPRPMREIAIHEDVCEGCGDCGRRSTCASLRPTETPLGRKTRIHTSSCSDDRSCLAGDCPSFLSVAARPRRPSGFEREWSRELPPPAAPRWDRDRYEIFMIGVGSTGVVTIDALIVRAAELEGLHALHLDQTGLAQRGGQVVSHCVLGREPLSGSPRVGWSGADVLLAFDPLGAADAKGLRMLDPARTQALVQMDSIPTAEMVVDAEPLPDLAGFVGGLRARSHSLECVAGELIAEAALGEARCANVVMLGVALQRGLLPVGSGSLEQAIRENGVAVETNLAALRLGRAVACDPELVERITADARPPAAGENGSLDEAARMFGALWLDLDGLLLASVPDWSTAPERRRVAGFALDLVDYQSERYARRFLRALLPVARAVSRVPGSARELATSAARELYRLKAYKDEYEVARLLLRGPYRRWLERRSGEPLRLRYHLHPPLLRALGLRRKLELGRWVEPLLAALVPLRWLRGTRLDPFGFSRVRREERRLGAWYERILEQVAAQLRPEKLEHSRRLVLLPASIRGFETLKLERIRAARTQAERLLAALSGR